MPNLKLGTVTWVDEQGAYLVEVSSVDQAVEQMKSKGTPDVPEIFVPGEVMRQQRIKLEQGQLVQYEVGEDHAVATAVKPL